MNNLDDVLASCKMRSDYAGMRVTDTKKTGMSIEIYFTNKHFLFCGDDAIAQAIETLRYTPKPKLQNKIVHFLTKRVEADNDGNA